MATEFRGIDLIIGYGNPINQFDMYFNLHFLMNKYEWDEKVTFSNLLKLKYSIDYERSHSAPVPSSTNTHLLFYEFHQRFSEEFNEKFVTKYLSLIQEASDVLVQKEMAYIKQMLSDIEKWLLYILNHLLEFSLEVRNFCQQFFFTSTISQSCFRLLLKTKEQLEELFEEIQAVKTIVLEKASAAAQQSGREESKSSSSPAENVMTINNLPESSASLLYINYDPISIPAGKNAADIAKDGKLVVRGQVLSSDSPLAQKLQLLKQNPTLPVANNSPQGRGSKKVGFQADPSPPAAPVLRKQSEIDRIIELLQTTGVACHFFLPVMKEQNKSTIASQAPSNEGDENPSVSDSTISTGKISPARLLLKNYIPPEILSGTNNDAHSYLPNSCQLEIQVLNDHLQHEYSLSFAVVQDVEELMKGIGSHLTLPPDASHDVVEHLFHIRLKNDRPEILLSLTDGNQVRQDSMMKSSSSSPASSAHEIQHFLQLVVKAVNYMMSEVRLFSKSQRFAQLTNRNSSGNNSTPKTTSGNRFSFSFGVGSSKENRTNSLQNNREASAHFSVAAIADKDPEDKRAHLEKATSIYVSTRKVNFQDEEEEELEEERASAAIRANAVIATAPRERHPKNAVKKVLREMKEVSILTIKASLWMKVYENSWFNMKGCRLLIVRSDRMIEIFKVPKEYNDIKPKDLAAVKENRAFIQQKLDQMKRSKFSPKILEEAGFIKEASYVIDAISCTENPDEENEDNSVQIAVAGRSTTFFMDSGYSRQQLLSQLRLTEND